MGGKRVETLDTTRRWSAVHFEGVQLGAEVVMCAADKAWPRLKRALEWATAALCAEMVGGVQKVLETSTEYTKTRQQFRKPIAIYQAVSNTLHAMRVPSENDAVASSNTHRDVAHDQSDSR